MKHLGLYVLNDEHELVEAEDVLEWAKWYEKNQRVALDYIGERCVSTVFMGTALGHGRLWLFETMVFDSEGATEDQARYSTWQEAMDGHKAMLAAQRKKLQ